MHRASSVQIEGNLNMLGLAIIDSGPGEGTV
jgi:hypothetical protein